MLTNVLLYSAFTVPCMQKTHIHMQDDAPGISGISVSLNYTLNLFPAKREACSLGVSRLQLNLVRCSFFNINDV